MVCHRYEYNEWLADWHAYIYLNHYHHHHNHYECLCFLGLIKNVCVLLLKKKKKKKMFIKFSEFTTCSSILTGMFVRVSSKGHDFFRQILIFTIIWGIVKLKNNKLNQFCPHSFFFNLHWCHVFLFHLRPEINFLIN